MVVYEDDCAGGTSINHVCETTDDSLQTYTIRGYLIDQFDLIHRHQTRLRGCQCDRLNLFMGERNMTAS
jgi:hypothetical protein